MAVLEGVAERWSDIGEELYVPHATLDFISSEGGSEVDHLRAVVRYWLLRDPLASWRRLMWQLDQSDYHHLCAVAGSIRSYAEKLTGQHVNNREHTLHGHWGIHMQCIRAIICQYLVHIIDIAAGHLPICLMFVTHINCGIQAFNIQTS